MDRKIESYKMEYFIYNSPAFRDFLKEHDHEGAEVKFLESIVEDGMNVIDIGANIGITTVAIAKNIGKAGRVFSFEPVAEYFDILKKNISTNGLENVELYEQAVTDQVGKADFYQKGLSSGIVREKGVKRRKVSTTAVDRFLSEKKIVGIDVINMDCEGSELLVLQGARETLRKNTVKIFCEIHPDFLRQLGQSIGDIVEYLQKLAFKVKSVSLDDLSIGNDFENCKYIYAEKIERGSMPTYDYKCKECGEVFELFRHLSEIDGAVKCPHCGSIKTQKLFSTPQIRGETVAGSGYGKTLSPQVNRSTATGLGRGLRGGRGGGRGMGRGWRRSQ